MVGGLLALLGLRRYRFAFRPLNRVTLTPVAVLREGHVRASPAEGTGAASLIAQVALRAGGLRAALAQSGALTQRGGLVGLLPGEVVVLAAEVAVGGGLLVDRPVQVEVLAEGARAQVEVLVDQPRRSRRATFSVPKVSTMTDTGCATPMAYATCTSQRSASPAATTFLAT